MEQDSSSKFGLKIFMEFLGTFILCGAINLSTCYYKSSENNVQAMQPILVFLAFFTAITITRSISGGHINPAVTLAVMISEYNQLKNQTLLYIFYIISQIFGAFAASVFSYIFDNKGVLQIKIVEGNTSICGFFAEAIGTFFFIYLILCQGNPVAKIQEDQTISTFLITVGLFAGGSLAGSISGGILNPAIGMANIIVRLIAFKNTNDAKNIWVYICGPLLGGVCAALLYSFFFKPYFDDCYLRSDLIQDNINTIPNENLIKVEEEKKTEQ